MKAALIINSKAKNANKQTLAELYSGLNKAGLDVVEFNPNDDVPIAEFAEAAVRDAFELVIAAGGDGTISAVASKLVGTNSKLGVLPIGTYNNFAKGLGIPLDLHEAAQVLVNGVVREVSVGEVNGALFINNSSIGIYPHIVMRREKMESKNGKRLVSSFLALAKSLWKFPYYHVKVKFDGQDIRQHSPMVFVGNGFYGYDAMSAGQRGLMDQEKLSVYVLKNANRFDLLKLSVKALLNRIHEDPKFQRYYVSEVEIHLAKKSVYVAKDGEVLKLEAPLRYRIRPKALKVILPK